MHQRGDLQDQWQKIVRVHVHLVYGSSRSTRYANALACGVSHIACRVFRSVHCRTMAKPVPIGTRAEVQRRVEREHTLHRHHPELPPVLSTPEMIGLMEWACFIAQEPYCDAGEVTVGTRVCIG